MMVIGKTVVAPSLLYYEVSNALHRYVVHGELPAEEAAEALETVLAMDITLHGDTALHQRALDLANRFSLSSTYDTHYLALAESLNAELWTADRRLARSMRPHFSWIHET